MTLFAKYYLCSAIINDCSHVFCRYVYLCSGLLSGLVQNDPTLPSAAVADLANQLLPSLLLLHRDAVLSVRITLARCLAQHFVSLGTIS